MKKYVVVFVMVCAFLPVLVCADDGIKDNSLHIDSERLEEKRADNSNQSDLASNLFSNEADQVLKKAKNKETSTFNRQKAQLFSQKSKRNTDVNQVKKLFRSRAKSGQYVTKSDTDTSTTSQTGSSGLVAILYGVVCLLLICGASFATFMVGKKEDI